MKGFHLAYDFSHGKFWNFDIFQCAQYLQRAFSKSSEFCLYFLKRIVIQFKSRFCDAIFSRFQTQYGPRAHTALAYAMNSEFARILSAQMACIAIY